MVDGREKNLPKWAQEFIAELREEIVTRTESLVKEVAILRPRVLTLETANGALMELLRCAANGGHLGAAEIVKTLEGWGLELVKED